LLGLRSPIPAGNALIVPIKLRDQAGRFSADNLQTEAPIRLALGGQGIRDLHYDSKLKSFLIISGAPENQRKSDFLLWQWDGSASPRQFNQNAVLDREMKPEGIAQVKMGDREWIFIVGDDSRYLNMEYPTAPAAQ
jgi:hypothetical protein